MAAFSPLAEPTSKLHALIAELPIVQSDGPDTNTYDALIYHQSTGEDLALVAVEKLRAMIEDGATEIVWRERPQIMQYENARKFSKALVMNFRLVK